MRPELMHYDLASWAVAFSTTRLGGVSRGPYASFNVNAYCGDDPGCVARNREVLAATLGVAVDHIVIPHQIHETHCRAIGTRYLESDGQSRRQLLEGVDAVMTSQRGVCVGVSTADCIPLLLLDTRRKAVAAVHAGWRGTRKRIVETVVRAMRDTFGTEPASLRCVIGPGISMESFEVGQEVYDAFAQGGFDMGGIAKRMPRMHADDPQPEKWHIDLKQCNRNQLLAAGVPASGITDCAIDTLTDSRFFSARRQGIASGRIFTAILLK